MQLRIETLSIALLLLAAFCGCTASKPPTELQLPPFSGQAGTLIHVVGWDGAGAPELTFLLALRDGGCPMAMETFDWTDGWRSIFALWRAQHSKSPSRQLAAHLVALHEADPNQPICMTADSSGCGVALDAIALLPPDVRIRTVILSSPALSPHYDLRPALSHVDDQLISFNSDRDWFVLCLGTTIFATVDGHHSASAGRDGFERPQTASVDDYRKLTQIPYSPTWAAPFKNNGGHSQALSPRFAKSFVAPLLR